MIVDLHNHTPLCNHAVDKPILYAQKAIENKTKFFGFSDHAPMNFDQAYRMKFSQMQDYEKEILQIKEILKDKIEILLAYEVDWLPGFLDEKVLQRKVDYFIGSVHFLNSWGFDNPEYIGVWQNKNIDEIYEKYFEAIFNLANSNKFDIVGHFDLIKIFDFKPKKDIRILAQKALKAIKKADLVMELNSAGFRKPCCELYPGVNLLEIMAELDIKITFSSDAHAANQVGLNGEKTQNLAKKFGFSEVAIFKNRDRQMLKF